MFSPVLSIESLKLWQVYGIEFLLFLYTWMVEKFGGNETQKHKAELIGGGKSFGTITTIFWGEVQAHAFRDYAEAQTKRVLLKSTQARSA